MKPLSGSICDEYPCQIMPLYPQGTNSTFFTECCLVAICDDQANCPRCGRRCIGYDLDRDARHRVRWDNATRFWSRKTR